ncbi:MAG: hypothetical protein WDZ83_09955 [Rhizobiaceae bacterium]
MQLPTSSRASEEALNHSRPVSGEGDREGYARRIRGYYITHRREADVSAIGPPITIKGAAIGSVNLAWVNKQRAE